MPLRQSVFTIASITVLLGAAYAYSQVGPVEVIVSDDPRPVLDILNRLEAKYGWQMTYEDPPYESAVDLTDRSSPEFLREHPGKKSLIPRGKHLEFPLRLSPTVSADRSEVLGELLRVHGLSGNPGIFSISNTGAVFHVEPSRLVKNNGNIVRVHSILDATITFPRAPRTGLETLQLILSSLTAKTGVQIVPGALGVSLLSQTTSIEGPQGETAKEVVLRIFEGVNRRAIAQINQPRRLVWQIMYEPDSRTYFFNTHVVMIEEETPFGKMRRPI
jgi:hypothetical protein